MKPLAPKFVPRPPTPPLRSGASPVIIQLTTIVARPGTSPPAVLRMETIPVPDPNLPHTVTVIDSKRTPMSGVRVDLRVRPVGSGAWSSRPSQTTSAGGTTTFGAISGTRGLTELMFTATQGAASASKTLRVLV